MNMDKAQKDAFLQNCLASKVPIGNFGYNNARCYWNWKFVPNINDCPLTRDMLEFTFDLRLPLALTQDTLSELADVILYSVDRVIKGAA